jgi:hypothetical protein
MSFRFVRLNSGWDDPEFEDKLGKLSDKMSREGYSYYDIKITSNGNASLVIYNREEGFLPSSY